MISNSPLSLSLSSLNSSGQVKPQLKTWSQFPFCFSSSSLSFPYLPYPSLMIAPTHVCPRLLLLPWSALRHRPRRLPCLTHRLRHTHHLTGITRHRLMRQGLSPTTTLHPAILYMAHRHPPIRSCRTSHGTIMVQILVLSPQFRFLC
jgi:hypothetical protein